MSKKHTPGPWEYLGDPENDECRIRQTASVRMGNGYCAEHTVCQEVSNIGNAKLIAAAPDMLNDLVDAAAQLRAYEILHRAKGTDDSTAKAEVNAALASRFEATIAKATE
jgi:hypothetical protein